MPPCSDATSHELSQIFTHVAPAGQFTHIWIESRDKLGRPKSYGGDSWRVMVRSDQATLAADVFDFNNGTYEALVLLMDPGTYTLDVRLDYTLCDGLRNPPVEQFYKRKCRGEWEDAVLFICLFTICSIFICPSFTFSVHCWGVLKNKKDIGTELFANMQDYINQPMKVLGQMSLITMDVQPSNIDPSGKITGFNCFVTFLF